MDIPGWIDEDIIYNPMYWLLTAGAEFALLIGFKAQSYWGAGLGMSLWSKILTLALIPVGAYFVFGKVSR